MRKKKALLLFLIMLFSSASVKSVQAEEPIFNRVLSSPLVVLLVIVIIDIVAFAWQNRTTLRGKFGS